MQFLLLLIPLAFLLLVIFTIPKPPTVTQLAEIIEPVRKCPPHKWRYLEVKDTEGTTIRWKLICDLCGPLKPSNGPARME